LAGWKALPEGRNVMFFDQLLAEGKELGRKREELSIIMGMVKAATRSHREPIAIRIIGGDQRLSWDFSPTDFVCGSSNWGFFWISHRIIGVQELPWEAVNALYEGREDFLQALPVSVRANLSKIIARPTLHTP
jgi:hypothetical protein